MFGKKKQALPPYILQVLTTDYLIDGTVEADTYLEFPDPGDTCIPVHFASARIQSTALADFAARNYAQFGVHFGNAVALIPGMDVQRMEQYSVWEGYDTSVIGRFFCGPYEIEGRFMTSSEDILDDEIPAYDVRITRQNAGFLWKGLFAPFALVNLRWVQGYEIS